MHESLATTLRYQQRTTFHLCTSQLRSHWNSTVINWTRTVECRVGRSKNFTHKNIVSGFFILITESTSKRSQGSHDVLSPPVIRTAAALPLYTCTSDSSIFTKSMVVLLGGRGGLFGVFGGIWSLAFPLLGSPPKAPSGGAGFPHCWVRPTLPSRTSIFLLFIVLQLRHVMIMGFHSNEYHFVAMNIISWLWMLVPGLLVSL